MATEGWAHIAVTSPTKATLDQRKREVEVKLKRVVTWDELLLEATKETYLKLR